MNANEFLSKYNLQISIEKSNTKIPVWEVYGNHYRVSVSAKGRKIAFDYWGSEYDQMEGTEPTRAEILECISSDIFYTDIHEILNLGYDKKKDARVINNILKHAQKLNEFFTEEEKESLGEIDW